MSSSVPPSADIAADLISYDDLYARWERGNWCATELDFTEDRRQWREDFTEFERSAALWNYALFFWGEDAVADNLSPYIDAAPLEEQKYFLATQQVDEARHSIFFKRFMHEVCDIGDGSTGSALRVIEAQLTPGFRHIFARLDSLAGELRRDRSKPKLAAAVALYHIVIEASLAQPGQHMICSYLERRELLPAFRGGMANIAADEQRHIAFGVKLLADLAREDERCAGAVAKLLREVIPWTASVLQPPNRDERYLTVFGVSRDEIGAEGATSLETKLRSAGLSLESLPGAPILPLDLTPVERSRRGHALVCAGVLGERTEPTWRDADTVALLFDTVRRSVDPQHGFKRAVTLQWEFTDPDVETWRLRIDNGATAAEQGAVAHPDLRLQTSYQDWADIIGGRLDARRALLTRRLRPRGDLRLLAKLPKIFG
ncbi:MAG: ribonucleotide-diphosphate reductase subunit beta [Solirubrobacteraceae bacterium]